jgi:hypothetical protein
MYIVNGLIICIITILVIIIYCSFNKIQLENYIDTKLLDIAPNVKCKHCVNDTEGPCMQINDNVCINYNICHSSTCDGLKNKVYICTNVLKHLIILKV